MVSFAIAQDGKQLPDVWKYNASYTRHGRTARFGIEFLLARVSSAENQPRSGNGSFVADPKSYDADMLQDLKTALKSTVAAQSDIRVRRLPFTFVIEGENLDRGKNGDLIDAATGNWVKAKLVLGPQQDQEVFLNFQKPGGTGEFAVVDPTFGNAVLRELAKVL